MSRAHTPGPWTAKPTMLRAVCITSASGPVATTSSASTVSREVNIANARLIAAAPDLLAALRAWVESTAFDEQRGSMAPVYEAARVAIAKATGEAQS